LLQTYLHILRFESINGTSPSLFLNPWRLSLKDIFPDIHFKSISNVSNIFSPSFTRALFVRHPFERLASAYKERIATLGKDRIQPEPHYDAVRKMICRRYTRFDSAQHPLPRRNLCEEFIPPFEHFVQYILMNTQTPVGVARMDGHWQPYAVVCQVCKFKYNFIGKYETFNDDFTSLLKRLNVSDWNIQKQRGASGHTTWEYHKCIIRIHICISIRVGM
jgi:chondroitin 4-sulfotransferase 11